MVVLFMGQPGSLIFALLTLFITWVYDLHLVHSPVESLYVKANKAPLSLRREKLALQYYTKLQSYPSNPAFECTINPKYKELFARKESAIPTFGIRMQSVLKDSEIENNNVHETIISGVPPWILHNPKV